MTRKKNHENKCHEGISPLLTSLLLEALLAFKFALFTLHSISTTLKPAKFCVNTRRIFPYLKSEPPFSYPANN